MKEDIYTLFLMLADPSTCPENYSVTELELLAFVWAIQHYRLYLYVIPISLQIPSITMARRLVPRSDSRVSEHLNVGIISA